VIEIGNLAAAYCGRLLADLGAEVIKVEPPGGDSARRVPPLWPEDGPEACSIAFVYANASKRSVVLDLASATGRAALRRLAAGADVLVESFAPGELDALGLGYRHLSPEHSALIMTSITGFGQDGPYRDHAWNDAVAFAMSGLMATSGPAGFPPMRLPGSLVYYIGGIQAAAGTAMALLEQEITRTGVHIDISMQEALTSISTLTGVAKFLEDGVKETRGEPLHAAGSPSGLYPCRDGLIALSIGRPHMWAPLARWIAEVTGHTEVLDPIFNDRYQRIANADLVQMWVSDLTSRFTMDEAFHQGQARGLVMAPLNTCASLLDHRQLAARRYFIEIEHAGRRVRCAGAPYALGLTPWAIAGPVPAAGQHTEEVLAEVIARDAAGDEPASRPSRSNGPAAMEMPNLAKMRFLEISVGGAVPWLCKHLSWHGAEIIRIEMKAHPDALRSYVSPTAPEKGVQPNRSPWHPEWHSGKDHVGINLETPGGQRLFAELVSISDAVLTNLGPGATQRLGLTYPRLRSFNPSIILLQNTAFGVTGPYARYKAWGMQTEAIAGLTHLSRHADSRPVMARMVLPDWMASLYGIVALMAALRERRRTGQGQFIDISMLELTVATIGDLLLQYAVLGRELPPLSNAPTPASPCACYPCQGQDRWCVIAAYTDADWAKFRSAMGTPLWTDDPKFATQESRLRHHDELDRHIVEWTRQRDAYEAMQKVQAAGVPAGVVQDVEGLLRDPHLKHRHLFVLYDHQFKGPVLGGGLAIRLRDPVRGALRAGRAVGQDNERVFGEVLGLCPSDVDRLYADQVIDQDDEYRCQQGLAPLPLTPAAAGGVRGG